ncbi:sigma factor-like helix-turn-helix DNA-binding protein [Candidatus Ruminimicrobium bovinum]|uniref:sigma factor-like helix-turn-helix DNA-binding protein n=1 Tax=Candidatus Ruminimicrobium bovinum TaxID=3242779 RepID=UPI0039B8F32D
MKGLKKYRSISDYETYTAKEIARKLNINVRSVYKYYAKGMKSIESSYPLLFSGSSIKEFIKGRLEQKRLQTK